MISFAPAMRRQCIKQVPTQIAPHMSQVALVAYLPHLRQVPRGLASDVWPDNAKVVLLLRVLVAVLLRWWPDSAGTQC